MSHLISKYWRVLDDGFVALNNYMGSDDHIEQAARVSFQKGTRPTRDRDKLILYLMENAHTSPFEHCEIQLHVRVPMDTWRQWVRHRTANINEYSTRYSIAIDSMQQTLEDCWRLQDNKNKQGSDGFLPREIGRHLSYREKELHDLSREIYQERLDAGVAREQARKDLPLSTYTEAFWKIDLHNLFHFLKLRFLKVQGKQHAQLEIRQYAYVIGCIVKQLFPVAFNAWSKINNLEDMFVVTDLKLYEAKK